jgi:hypothetical protein
MAEDIGHVITSILCYLCKYLMLKHLEARGIEPLFPTPTSTKIQERLYPRGFRESKPSWKCLDGAGCYYFCYWVASIWRHPESQFWTACFRDENGGQCRITTKDTNSKKALKIAEEFEKAVKTKRQLSECNGFWTGYMKRFLANALFGAPFENTNRLLTAKKVEAVSSAMDDGFTRLQLSSCPRAA